MNMFEVNVTQTDCPHVHTSRKFQDIFILIMNTEVHRKKQTMFTLFYSADSDELSDALKYFASQPEVEDFSLASRKENVASALYKIDQTSLHRRIRQTGLRVHPMIVHKGVEKWFIICDEESLLTEELLSDELTVVLSLKRLGTLEFFERYLAELYRLNFIDIFSEISPEERKILDTAIEKGYFEWPRRIRLTDLGNELKMPKSTLSYHVRRIEKKVAKFMSGDVTRLPKTPVEEEGKVEVN